MNVSIVIFSGLVLYFILVYWLFNRHYRRSRKKWISNIPYNSLVKEVILFASALDNSTSIKYLPSIKISYHKHSKWGGCYRDNQITIYKKNINGVTELVTILLHEYAHHLQYRIDGRKFDKKYSELNKTVGYAKNDYELESQEFTKKWTKPCLTYLANKAIIVRSGICRKA